MHLTQSNAHTWALQCMFFIWKKEIDFACNELNLILKNYWVPFQTLVKVIFFYLQDVGKTFYIMKKFFLLSLPKLNAIK